ncbi:MAG TPA: hypothetical protein PKK94_21220, partial [Leptospiraceae bacterium]|nr:hypothetical protein [Leptospiraceae bacterium]
SYSKSKSAVFSLHPVFIRTTVLLLGTEFWGSESGKAVVRIKIFSIYWFFPMFPIQGNPVL